MKQNSKRWHPSIIFNGKKLRIKVSRRNLVRSLDFSQQSVKLNSVQSMFGENLLSFAHAYPSKQINNRNKLARRHSLIPDQKVKIKTNQNFVKESFKNVSSKVNSNRRPRPKIPEKYKFFGSYQKELNADISLSTSRSPDLNPKFAKTMNEKRKFKDLKDLAQIV